MKFLAKNSKC